MSLKKQAAALLFAGVFMTGSLAAEAAPAFESDMETALDTTLDDTREAGLSQGIDVENLKDGVTGEKKESLLERFRRDGTLFKHQESEKKKLHMKRWRVQSEDVGGTLLFSDSPEYVTEDGILYQDVVSGDARILFYHLNNTSVNKKVAVILENTTSRPQLVKITRGGMSHPSEDFLAVGKATQIQYFDNAVSDTILLLGNQGRVMRKAMTDRTLYPGQLVYGVYDFSSPVPVRVSVIMYPEDANPLEFLKTARVLPKDEQRLRGTFRGMNRVIRSVKMYDPKRDGVVYFTIGDNQEDMYREGIDATDGSEVVNYGNYGILYRLDIPTTENGHKTQFYLNPLGGVYAGAMSVAGGDNSGVLMTPGARKFFGDKAEPETKAEMEARLKGRAVLKQGAELADLGSYSEDELSFEYSPPGASNLPVNIILMPADVAKDLK